MRLGMLPLPALVRRLVLPALFVGVITLPYLREPSAPPATPILALDGETMGTRYQVRLAGPLRSDAQNLKIAQGIAEALEAVNASMSTWREDSELSLLNRSLPGERVKLSEPLLEVMLVAEEVYERSGGAFDVTVGPLVNRWGFGPGEDRSSPSEEELEVLREALGQSKLDLSAETGSLARPHPDAYVDLSAIAKGYGVDEVARFLTEQGEENFMVEVGGEVRVAGDKGTEGPWRIAIERPQPGQPQVQEVLELSDISLATSGDYRNLRELDGELISHTVDPRTGRPAPHRSSSVSVLHPDCVRADAWATAMTVLGPEEGLQVAEDLGLAVSFLQLDDTGEPQRRSSSAFAAHQAQRYTEHEERP